MSRAELVSLAERVEALSGADREVDYAIWQVAQPRKAQERFYSERGMLPGNRSDDQKDVTAHARAKVAAPAFTASLDAAMGLYMDKPDVISTCPRKVCADALRQRAEVLGKGPEGRAQ